MVAPLNIDLATGLLSSSTRSTGMEVARGNGNVHWTSHMMMMMTMMMMSHISRSDAERFVSSGPLLQTAVA